MKQNKIPRNEYIRKPVGKTNPYKHDVLYTNLGQWKYPGQVTRIPSNDITMQGVPYPVYGEDDLGYSQMMYPGMDYTFPGQYVTEYPMAAYGGDPSLPNITGHYQGGGRFGDLRPTSDATKVVIPNLPKKPLSKKEEQEAKQYKILQLADNLEKAQKVVDKYNRINAANKAQEVQGFPTTRQEWADQTQAIGDKLSLQNLPVIGEYIPDILDVTGGIGSMASALGSAPLRAQQQDSYLPYITSVGAPLLAGAFAGIGAKNTKQFVNNVVNPFAGMSLRGTPKQLPGSSNVDEIMSLSAPKGNMHGENQVLVQQSRFLNPEIKDKFFANQAPLEEAYIKTNLLGDKIWKQPKDYMNRITRENYEDFVNNIHGSTGYDLASSAGYRSGNLGVGNYGLPGKVFSDAPLGDLGKDIINAHEKNHGMFAGTLSKEMQEGLLKPFGTKKPVPHYAAKHQADEVLARMGQFKNALGMGDDQVFTLGHLNFIRKNYANSFIDNGITEMLSKIKPGSKGEKEFLMNMNKYAFGLAPAAIIGAGALQEQKYGGWLDELDEEYRRGGSVNPLMRSRSKRASTKKNIQSSINKIFLRNYDLFGPGGKNIYDPKAKYQQGGGWLDNLD